MRLHKGEPSVSGARRMTAEWSSGGRCIQRSFAQARALQYRAGVSLEMASAATFWALFQAEGTEQPWDAHAERVQQRRRFSITGVSRRGSHIRTSFVMRFT